MSEEDRKQYGYDQRIGGEGQPDPLPVELTIPQGIILVDDDPADAAAQESAKTVGHHHEQTLGTGPDAGVALRFDIQ